MATVPRGVRERGEGERERGERERGEREREREGGRDAGVVGVTGVAAGGRVARNQKVRRARGRPPRFENKVTQIRCLPILGVGWPHCRRSPIKNPWRRPWSGFNVHCPIHCMNILSSMQNVCVHR